jgi:hypothetical protein
MGTSPENLNEGFYVLNKIINAKNIICKYDMIYEEKNELIEIK